MNLTLKEQIAGRCIHFNGIQNDKCEAGIEYESFAGFLPCLKWRKAAATCPKQQFPSAEDVAKELAEHEAETLKFIKLGPLLKSLKQQYRNTGFAGVVECPVCKGKLHCSVSSYNGHTRGQCETENCVAWIE